MAWVPRGLRDGIVTTSYPRRPDGYGPGFVGSVAVSQVPGDPPDALADAVTACPTAAIVVSGNVVQLDRGRCILCGRCSELAPGTFRPDPGFETATVGRRPLVVPARAGEEPDDATLAAARAALGRRVRALRRSVHVRHVDAGSDGSDEWEVSALTNPVYDVQRLGVFFTASPKHADLLLVTGVGSIGMTGPLEQVYDVMPHPKVVVGAGVEAVTGGMIGRRYASSGGVTGVIPVDVFVPGSPPSPFGLLYGILLAIGVLAGPVVIGAEANDARTAR
jgi:Ni,Fe-hydrogenase III small subunit/ferredoxin